MGSVLGALNGTAGAAAGAAGSLAGSYAGAGAQLGAYVADISKGILIIAAAGLGAGIVLSLVRARPSRAIEPACALCLVLARAPAAPPPCCETYDMHLRPRPTRRGCSCCATLRASWRGRPLSS